MNEKCKVCRFICERDKVFKIDSTSTLHSKTPLEKFIEIIIEGEFDCRDSFVCSICYDLFNELDKFRENYRIGCERIKHLLWTPREDISKNLVEDNVNVENHEDVIPTLPSRSVIKIIEDTPNTTCDNDQKSLESNCDENQDSQKQYVCELCGISYRTQKSLRVHVGMHNGVNPFKCEYCQKCFTQKINLIRHLPLHTGEMPYQCDLCGKRYMHDSSFRLHKKRHRGEKDVKCEKCGLTFFSKSHLTRHERVHSGEKNYTCRFCGKNFAEKYNLVAHERLHENTKLTIRNYRCNICDMSFCKRVSLESHLVQDHQQLNKKEGTLQIT